MVFMTVSTGVGGGVVSGGKPLTGPGGLRAHRAYACRSTRPVAAGTHRLRGSNCSGRGIAAAAQASGRRGCETIFTRPGRAMSRRSN
ncbi:ROK family protein [Shigella flexneri]